jgi:Putative silver efflux pump
MNDNFASIECAIEEGRSVYKNLLKAISFILPVNGGESMTILLSTLLGRELPILSLQILWLNMLNSITMTVPLAFEPKSPGVMQQQPRSANEPLLTASRIKRIIAISLYNWTVIFGMFEWVRQADWGTIELARTMAIQALVMGMIGLVGGVISVALTGGIISVASLVGFVTLFGVATRNGLLLVDNYNTKFSEGMPFKEAIIKGSMERLNAILMTASTSALGLAPLVLEGGPGKEILQPLSVVVLGGLFTSTALTLLVLPALYAQFCNFLVTQQAQPVIEDGKVFKV